MKQPNKWRETTNPFTLKFTNFKLLEILGYPHAGNDVFYVKGILNNSEIKAFLKVERQATADIQNEIETILNLQEFDFPYLPQIIEYSLETPKFILTKEVEGERLSTIVGDKKVLRDVSSRTGNYGSLQAKRTFLFNNKNMPSMTYMQSYGKLLASIHSLTPDSAPIKKRNFTVPHEFYIEHHLEYVEDYLLNTAIKETTAFIHGDCHYANILWKDQKVVCLLDYELSGYGSKEYDLAWATILRPGQKFLSTEQERTALLNEYNKSHNFSKQAYDYYSVLFGLFFYKISPGEENKDYRANMLNRINNIISKAI